MGFPTDCIHAGQEPDPTTGATITPHYQTSTYVQQGIGQHKGYEYARTQNPARRALERNSLPSKGGPTRTASLPEWRPRMPCSPWSSRGNGS